MAGARDAGHGHSGATATPDQPHRVTRALRAVRIFAGAVVDVVLLGDYSDDLKGGRSEGVKADRRTGDDWRRERDVWADRRAPGNR